MTYHPMPRSEKVERAAGVVGHVLPLLQHRADTTYLMPVVSASPITVYPSTFNVKPEVVTFIRPGRATNDEDSIYWFTVDRKADTLGLCCQANCLYEFPLHSDVQYLSFYACVGTEELHGGFLTGSPHNTMSLP